MSSLFRQFSCPSHYLRIFLGQDQRALETIIHEGPWIVFQWAIYTRNEALLNQLNIEDLKKSNTYSADLSALWLHAHDDWKWLYAQPKFQMFALLVSNEVFQTKLIHQKWVEAGDYNILCQQKHPAQFFKCPHMIMYMSDPSVLKMLCAYYSHHKIRHPNLSNEDLRLFQEYLQIQEQLQGPVKVHFNVIATYIRNKKKGIVVADDMGDLFGQGFET